MMLLASVVVSSLLFAPTTPRRHPGARACASDAPASSAPPDEPSGKPADDGISAVPADMPMEGARSMRIDQRSMDNEQELWDKPVATREEMASVIPDWAAGLMLEGERRDEYESERADEQTRSYRKVDGRDWAEMYGDSDEALTGMGGDSAGMGAFTPVEISEDYNLPTETVTLVLALGLYPPDRDGANPSHDPHFSPSPSPSPNPSPNPDPSFSPHPDPRAGADAAGQHGCSRGRGAPGSAGQLRLRARAG